MHGNFAPIRHHPCVLALLAGALGAATACGTHKDPTPEDLAGWPVEVKGHVPVQPGEHPRLLFRKSDLPELRARAATPEGRAILARLRLCLNGGDGEDMPTVFGDRGPVTQDGAGQHDGDPPGTYTFSHAAGYAFLHLLSGGKRYADMARQCMDLAIEEKQRDRDRRYSFRHPFGALRAGPSLGWMALGYDLGYEGWDDAYRRKVAGVFAEYNEGPNMALAELTVGQRQHPGSNHWGMQVGGAALALLAIMNDPGVDMAKIGPLLEKSKVSMIVNMTQGFGDGGFFAEGDGTGSMSSHIVFLPAIQAWRVAAGQDFVSPRPNLYWAAMKWFFLTTPEGGDANLRAAFPERGGYPHNIWGRHDLSGAGYCSMGFGAARDDDQRAAILWFYEKYLMAGDRKRNTPFDATTAYPHHAILSLVNWPAGLKARDPDEVMPHAYRDTKWGFYAWRNRWQDAGDVVISILTRAAKGNMGAPAENTLTIQTGARKTKWGAVNGGFAEPFEPAADGSTVLVTGDGSSLAIDFSRASGADVMLAMTGPGAPADGAVAAGGRRFSFLFLGGKPPQPAAQGDKVAAGGQTVSFDGRKLVLGR